MQITIRPSILHIAPKLYKQPKAGLTYEPMSLTYQPMTLREKGLDDMGNIPYKNQSGIRTV